jgi:hypothetical protein
MNGNESKIETTDRLRAEGRWAEASAYKDEVLRGLRAEGMKKADAGAEAWRRMQEKYPPLETTEETTEVVEEPTEAQKVLGLCDIPVAWGELPANARLQDELGWVQSNRLAIVQETETGIQVHLDKARSPAPSWAALGWLETSIRSYTKYVDVVAKSLKDEQDEQSTVRREKLAIEEIRALLAEMCEQAGE